MSTARGFWAVKWSFVALMGTAALQAGVVWISGSVALLADTIHNVGDAATAIPLGIAFWLARRGATRRFTYGLGRAEDLAGLAIVLIVLVSALLAAYESGTRLVEPRAIGSLWAVALAAGIGFLGNEAVAVFRIRVGRQIGSAALVADGHHARVDGLVSLSVLGSVAGAWLGYPLADPLVGLLITVVILGIVWQTGKSVFTRLLDGVDPETVAHLREAAAHAPGVQEVGDIRIRWVGHRLHAELSVAVNPGLSVAEGHEIAREVRHRLLHRIDQLADATIHVDPATAPGNAHHRIPPHEHDQLPAHSHF
jgi:cation diffusion facilitator family transporter